jgi:hypothetical protein
MMNTSTTPVALVLLLSLLLTGGAHAILQTAEIDVQLSNGATYTLLASQASFGAYPKMGASNNEPHLLTIAPHNNALLCQNVTKPGTSMDGTFIMVPRGECTFETKAMNAQRLGAAGVIVRGSLDSRYAVNKTTQETIFPSEFNDYDCAKGSASIPASAVAMPSGAYDWQQNDAVLSGTSASNLCLANSDDKLENCPSKACLLTGNKTGAAGESLQACCAWDLHIWLYNDPTFKAEDVTIPAVYISLEQSDLLLHDLQMNQINVVVSSRVRSSYNMSAMLIWALGVFVAAVAAYSSASDIRRMTQSLKRRIERRGDRGSEIPKGDAGSVDEQEESAALMAAPQSPVRAYSQPVEETLELGAEHALGFIVMASSGLLVLFFFKVRYCCSLHYYPVKCFIFAHRFIRLCNRFTGLSRSFMALVARVL